MKQIFCFEEFKKKYSNDKVCMYCDTYEDVDAFLCYLDSIGETWFSGTRYSEHSNIDEYGRDNTVFYFLEGTYASLRYAKDRDVTILKSSDFDFSGRIKSDDFEDSQLEVSLMW